MIAILAPAKTMDFETEIDPGKAGLKTPLFSSETLKIISFLRSMDVKKIMGIMKVSKKIAEEVHNNLSLFSNGDDELRCRPAAFAYTGETFKGLSPNDFEPSDLTFAEKNIRILSGLYGILSPLTLIEPYRLEMGLKLEAFYDGKLSAFWKENITGEINRLLLESNEKILVNLASQEYMAALDKRKLDGEILDISFKQEKENKLKTVGTFSKKARGMMASYIVKERIESIQLLKGFKKDGYLFREELSEKNHYVFVRKV